MFEAQESTPWYRSTAGLIGACLLLPPLGLILLWSRRDAATRTKIVGTVGIVLLGLGYFYLIGAWRKSSANDAHYAALEQHRAQQETLPPTPGTAPATAASQPATVAQPAASGPAANAPIAGNAPETAAAHASRNYWTNFRGPNRDGRYDEMEVLKTWPAAGLSPIWKQPIGVGYASFVIADGRAYTIEQRRGQEVATAYDVATGREIWKQGWNARIQRFYWRWTARYSHLGRWPDLCAWAPPASFAASTPKLVQCSGAAIF